MIYAPIARTCKDIHTRRQKIFGRLEKEIKEAECLIITKQGLKDVMQWRHDYLRKQAELELEGDSFEFNPAREKSMILDDTLQFSEIWLWLATYTASFVRLPNSNISKPLPPMILFDGFSN